MSQVRCFNFSRFGFIVRTESKTDGQNHRDSDDCSSLLTYATPVGVSNAPPFLTFYLGQSATFSGKTG